MTEKKKGFFSRIFDRVDKNLEEKSKEEKCCCCQGSKDKEC